jgi:hypothetical protein
MDAISNMKTLCADTTVPNAVFANWIIYSIQVATLKDVVHLDAPEAQANIRLCNFACV